MNRKLVGIFVCILFFGASVVPSISGIDFNIPNNKIENLNLISEPPEEEWNVTFSGNNNMDDIGRSVQQTSDGGYIITGRVNSNWYYLSDLWLIKTDNNGNLEWEKTFGGSGWDDGYSVQQTSDGGYIIVGETSSYGAGAFDVWLIKTDDNGDEEWNKTFGNWDMDWGRSVQQTNDDGYIIVGFTNSTAMQYAEVWLIKTDSNGSGVWSKTFGGTYDDGGNFVQQTIDGGYIISGYTSSFGNYAHWLIKTDSSGNEIWNNTYSTSNADGFCVQQTTDNGFIATGNRMWLLKTDSDGNEIWNLSTYPTIEHNGRFVQQVTDGGYVVTGNGPMGGEIIKTDPDGNELWNKTYASPYGWEELFCVKQTSDEGFIIVGYKESIDNDLDVWLIKIAGDNDPPGIPTITGETNGNAGTEYEYTFNSVDPEGDDVKYHIDWDDGNTETTDFSSSGTDVKVKHTWANQDTYVIRVTAEDTNGLIGPEGTLTVTMPRNRAISTPFLQFLEQHPILFQLLQRFLRL